MTRNIDIAITSLIAVSALLAALSLVLKYAQVGDSFQVFLASLGFLVATLVACAVRLARSINDTNSVQLPQP